MDNVATKKGYDRDLLIVGCVGLRCVSAVIRSWQQVEFASLRSHKNTADQSNNPDYARYKVQWWTFSPAQALRGSGIISEVIDHINVEQAGGVDTRRTAS